MKVPAVVGFEVKNGCTDAELDGVALGPSFFFEGGELGCSVDVTLLSPVIHQQLKHRLVSADLPLMLPA